jgi:hypothetical protein
MPPGARQRPHPHHQGGSRVEPTVTRSGRPAGCAVPGIDRHMCTSTGRHRKGRAERLHRFLGTHATCTGRRCCDVAPASSPQPHNIDSAAATKRMNATEATPGLPPDGFSLTAEDPQPRGSDGRIAHSRYMHPIPPGAGTHRCLNTNETTARHSHEHPAGTHRCLNTNETTVRHSPSGGGAGLLSPLGGAGAATGGIRGGRRLVRGPVWLAGAVGVPDEGLFCASAPGQLADGDG